MLLAEETFLLFHLGFGMASEEMSFLYLVEVSDHIALFGIRGLEISPLFVNVYLHFYYDLKKR